MNILHYLTEGIWRDEAFSYLLAKHSFIEIIFLTVKDFNPPLYYFLLHIWMSLFGTSEIAMRSLSLFFYVIGVFCIYELFKVILNKTHKQAALYTFLSALNPIVFYYAFETRMYSMLFCWAMASTFYYFKKDWRNYSIIAIFGLYTHYFMALVLIVQFIHLLIPLLKSKPSLKKLWFEMKQYVYIGLGFLPWALFFLFQNESASSQYWIIPLKPFEIFTLPALTYSGIEKDFAANLEKDVYLRNLLIGFTLFFVVCLAAGIKLVKKKREMSVFWYSVALSFVPLLIIIGGMAIKPLYVPRYLVFVSAAISLVMVLAIMEMKKWQAAIGVIILFLFTVQFNVIEYKLRQRDTTREVIAKIKPVADIDDYVYVQSELDYMTAQYYFNETHVKIYGKTYEEIPSYVGKVIIPESAVATEFPKFPHKAYLITGPDTYEIHSLF